MTARDPKRTGALSALREGRVTLLTVRTREAESQPALVVARVAGHHGVYAVDLDHTSGDWACTCRDGQGCAHILAVQLVTGHAPAAAA